MKHLHFVQSLEPLEGGGLGSAALGLHAALSAMDGATSSLLATRSPTFAETWAGVRQFPRVGPAKAFFAPGLARAAGAEVAAADVVHGHGFYTYPNACIGAAARRRAKPLVYHVHGFFEDYILARSRWKKQLAHALFENANVRAARFWRAINAREIEQIRSQGITAPVELIPNGIDIAAVRQGRDALGTLPDKPCRSLLFLSRIHPKKGLDLLIPAWADLAPRVPGWELHIVGPDEGGYAQTVDNLIAQTRAPRVHRTGAVFGQAKTRAFAEADAFVLPSHSEGFPMVLLEAAAHGLPILHTSACNFPELALRGGSWCAEASFDSIRTTLEALLSADEAERAQRAALGRELVEREFSWHAMAQRLEAACQRHCG